MDTKNNTQGKLRVTCESCGKSFGIRIPAKPGNYNVTCPHCAKPISISFTKKEAGQVAPSERGRKISAPRIVAPILGKTERVKDRVYVVKTRAIVNRPYRVVCPDCGNNISLLTNEAGKTAKASCKKCHAVVFYRAVEKPSSGAGKNVVNTGISAPRIQAPILGKIEKVKDRVYVVKTKAIVNRPYRVVCPDCGTDISLLTNEAGRAKARCKKCKSVVYYKATDKESSTGINVGKKSVKAEDVKSGDDKPKRKTQKIAVPKGAVTWKQGRCLLSRTKVKHLKEGSNIIGRKDDTSPSDIMIEKDDEISRRSVAINVVYNDEKRDFIYELKVLRNTNPVYVNGRPVGHDEIVRLNYNDIICLGKTNVTFIQNKEKK